MPAARTPAMPAFLMRERRSIDLSPGLGKTRTRLVAASLTRLVSDHCKKCLHDAGAGFPCGNHAVEALRDGALDAFGVQADARQQLCRIAVFDEAVGQPELQHRLLQPCCLKSFED